MEKLDSILRDHVAKSTETKDKLLGASFFVVNKNGEFRSSLIFSTCKPPGGKTNM